MLIAIDFTTRKSTLTRHYRLKAVPSNGCWAVTVFRQWKDGQEDIRDKFPFDGFGDMVDVIRRRLDVWDVKILRTRLIANGGELIFRGWIRGKKSIVLWYPFDTTTPYVRYKVTYKDGIYTAVLDNGVTVSSEGLFNFLLNARAVLEMLR